MSASIFWYDFETTGINPRSDRPLQVAGIRTDVDLNEVGQPLNLYCQLSDDILPNPHACLVTGIEPDTLLTKGLTEAEFFKQLYAQIALPQTCTAGYNSLRFDDEVMRYGLYRNFYDPYAREWQGGNSRWDIIDLLRAAYALRPEGIVWPEQEGRVSLRLELLTAVNGICHEQAHDALSDVRATIAMARLVKAKQPRLYDYLFNLRLKREVQARIGLLKPMVHISGMFSAERHYCAVVLPLMKHPTNSNAIVACDLQRDITPLLTLSSEMLKAYLYTRHDELPDGVLPVPLKLIHLNRCPVVAPLGVLREKDSARLQLNMDECLQRADQLIAHKAIWQDKLMALYQEGNESFSVIDDPEQQLYAGFLSARDKRLCDDLRQMLPHQLKAENIHFEDQRLAELLLRYRARNYRETLNSVEQHEWSDFCRVRLTDTTKGAPITIEQFIVESQELLASGLENDKKQLLEKWLSYVDYLSNKYCVI